MAKKANKSAIGIANAITQATNAVSEFQLPFVEKATFSNLGKQLAVAPDAYRNAWYDNLVNLCGLQIVLGKRMYESYFKKLYREATFTESVALYMVDAIKAKAYDKEATAAILENNPARVGAQYIQTVLRRRYDVSDIEELSISAFNTEGAFLSMIDAVTTQLYSSMEDDNVEMIKELLKANITEGNIRLEPATKPDTQTQLLDFMRVVKRIGSDWAVERSRKYNLAGYRTFSPQNDHYFLMNTDMDALNEVFNLPFSYHKSYLEMKSEGESIVMGSDGLGPVYSMMFDRDFMQVRDKVGFPKFTSFYNDATLSMNRFLHAWTVLSVAYFANAIAFVDPSDVEIVSATLGSRDGSAAMNPGEEKEIYVSAIVAGEGKIADKFGTYSVAGTSTLAAGTTIDPDSGVLTVGEGEQNSTLTVTWTSHLDESVTATIAITVNN